MIAAALASGGAEQQFTDAGSIDQRVIRNKAAAKHLVCGRTT
jgi:hypothetical protein